ncbi:hypothetical protein [Aneurinibacillus aneurinilyticus]|uniref:hypothetical protein n=1 Tax=Aneurinibacillus aneurinilyticus TaxID=1391 RepID=UPI001FD805C4|nr:hypothetical protein [Aneurinibacillus aneurinilyticus]MED0705105.1 hypothetical protein [Aneurinibacillus aneurinilyticus]MED0724252.1 hypothetical protein [Aneurinibacillus aneurinilyticus]MED0733017.1 hypothetical protein [Aneurinibacillus aneurinilyticus]MED0743904.1 hypothetical protein [Aneurinibacillus aneurinilyticus]
MPAFLAHASTVPVDATGRTSNQFPPESAAARSEAKERPMQPSHPAFGYPRDTARLRSQCAEDGARKAWASAKAPMALARFHRAIRRRFVPASAPGNPDRTRRLPAEPKRT